MSGSNLTIFRKGLLLIGVPIAFQLILLGFLLHLQSNATDADKWAIHTKEVMAQAEEAYRLISDSVSEVRGAIITNNPNFSSDLGAASDKALPVMEHLRELVSDNPPQVARVDAFHAMAEALLARVGEERQLVSQGKQSEAVAMVATGLAEHSVQSLRDQLDSILHEEQRLDADRLTRVAQLRYEGYWFVSMSAAGTLVLAAAALYAFTRGIAGRLAGLAINASRLADRIALSAPMAGSDEIGQVDRAFHAAALRLAEAEAAEHGHRAEIEKRAGELANANSELARANDDLRFKTQENETFVYSVSHDLRSPLVNLQGFGRELAHSCEDLRAAASEPGVPADIRQRIVSMIESDLLVSVRFIQTAVTRSSNIIDALLRLSRAGRVEYRRTRVNVQAVVARVVDALQVSLKQRGGRIEVGQLSDADSDPAAVEQIFANLIGNAVNYLDPLRPGVIEIGAEAANEAGIRYFVRDNGLGIPAAYLPKMFVAFQRLHGQIATGEGVGLALVRRVVERLGGTVTAESVEGAGSTFYVTLPTASVADPQPSS